MVIHTGTESKEYAGPDNLDNLISDIKRFEPGKNDNTLSIGKSNGMRDAHTAPRPLFPKPYTEKGARRSQNSNRRVPSMRIEGEEEFQEEDVWSVLREGETSSPDMKIPKSHFSSSSSSSSSPWNIHRSKGVSEVKQSSAPMNVPDWSKVYGNTKSYRRSSHMHSNDDDGDDDGCMVPPHEWVARKLARTQISSFSMCEGIGRTLKGRDLSKMRNAVLTKTGFLE